MNKFENFTGLYPISKTLRFELIPQGKTLEYIEKSEILENDNYRAEKYEEVKDIIDGYHKWFINETLHDLHINWSELKVALENNRIEKSDASKKELQRVQKIKREEIYNAFIEHEAFQYLFKENLLSDLLPIQIEQSEDLDAEKKKQAVETFNRFSTYFTGFHENRKNIYSKEGISTSVTYRIVHDNFPKFLENMKVFEILRNECPEVISDTANELAPFIDGVRIEDIFLIDFFNSTFSQNGIDYYNRILGGVTTETGEKYRGINEFTNLYRQQHPEFGKSKKATKMVVLFKQILSDRDTLSFIPEMFGNDKQVQNSIQLFYNREISQFENEGVKTDVCTALATLTSKIAEFDTEKIYIQQPELPNVSQRLFGSWNELNACLFKYAELKFGTAEKVANRKKIDKWLKSDLFSFTELNKALEFSGKDERIENYFSETGIFAQLVKTGFDEAQSILETEYTSEVHLKDQQTDIEKIKTFLDALQNLMHLLKSLCVSEEADRDAAFYNEFDMLYNQLKLVVPLYNKVRNYITQKLFRSDKIKIYFENKGQFLGGWVDSQTENSDNGTQAGGYIFRKENVINEYDYYLGICSDPKLFRRTTIVSENDRSSFERLDYYQLKTASVYGNSYCGKHPYTEDKNELVNSIDRFVHLSGNNILIEKIAKDKVKSNPTTNTPSGYLNFIHREAPNTYECLLQDENFVSLNQRVVSALKATLATLVRVPKALVYAKKDYHLFSEIINDIDELSYEKAFSYFPVSQTEFENSSNRTIKPLLLFKISNKDLSFAENFEKGNRQKIGKKNLHTLYFEALMKGNQDTIDIGTGMVFHRVKSLNYNEKTLKYGHHSTQLNEKFSYPIIKDKRFASDKFLFHLSTEINYKEKRKPLNNSIIEFLTNNPDINIIGLDRGERHLIYLTLINQKGEILRQKTFNIVGNTNYHEKLNQREKERDNARKSWATIGKIKELKEGFLSLVIHEIAKIMVENNAIVVLEDLNFGFKRGRFKVEKQIYQKFEKMLIDKLNYLVFKDKKANEAGGVLKGYQLAEKFESFQKMGKQSGFLFYVPAAYTSKIDPTTGFVNMLNLNYTNMKDAQTLLSGMDKISFNADANYFEFELDYEKFKTNQTDHTNKWTICTVGEKRFTYNSATKETTTVNVTEDLKKLLDKFEVKYSNGDNIKDEICRQTDAKFFEIILWLLKLTMQMRNSNTKTEEDFILSPVKNSNGEFFRSNDDANGIWPADADANGAYHIALKGLYLVKECFNKNEKSLKIEHKNWFKFAQTRFNGSLTKNG